MQETNEQFSKRELLSNWDKYVDNSASNEADASQASNFEELLSKPVSVGGHFLFNSEKGLVLSFQILTYYNKYKFQAGSPATIGTIVTTIFNWIW